jgi:hypothetical protein
MISEEAQKNSKIYSACHYDNNNSSCKRRVYLFQNAVYPSTYSPSELNVTLTMQTVLNASLSEIIEGIEQSATFSLLKIEHGTMALE